MPDAAKTLRAAYRAFNARDFLLRDTVKVGKERLANRDQEGCTSRAV